MSNESLPRRAVLGALVSATTVGLAGCTSGLGGDAPAETDETPDAETATATPASTPESAPGTTAEPTPEMTPESTPETTVEPTSASTDDGSGQTGIAAVYPADGDADGEHTRELLLEPADFESVGPVREHEDTGSPSVSATLTADAAERFVSDLRDAGFLDEGTNSCSWSEDEDAPGWCLLTVVDGETVTGAGITPGLAEAFDSGAFVDDPTIALQTASASEAERFKEAVESQNGG